ncbi:MAG: hypothetical protein AAF682_10350 [Planctomycetota bacterium]
MENRPIHNNPAPDAIRPAGGSEPRAPRVEESSGETPAFQVLLERLSQSAKELEEKSAEVENPENLAGAVDQARESLNDALLLGDQLLEAWRAESQTKSGKEDRT